MGLSENVDLTVTMSDNSFVELPALILSQKHYTSLDNQVTIPYELTYHKDEIRSQAKITVSATLYVDGKLIYITDSPIEVINNGIYKNIDLLLVPAN
nr:YbaY family lipoprotein [Providencia alcalifaciens]